MSEEETTPLQEDDRELRQYPVTYLIERHEPPLTRAEVLALGRGGCHAMIGLTVMRARDGSRGQGLAAMEGSTGLRPPSSEIFLSWLWLAHSMMHDAKLEPRERAFAGEVFRAYNDLLESEDVAKVAPSTLKLVTE